MTMDLDDLRDLIHTTPGPTGPEIDAQARAWLGKFGLQLQTGGGDPVVLIVLAVDEDGDFKAFGVPGKLVDAQAHRDLAALNRAAFEFFFTADLRPDQFAGALRICGGTTEEPDVFEDQIQSTQEEADEDVDIDYDALRKSAGSWNEFRLASGANLPGPISHVYSATLCM